MADLSKMSDEEILARMKGSTSGDQDNQGGPDSIPYLAQPDGLAAQGGQAPQEEMGMLERFSQGAQTGESPGVVSPEFLGANIGPMVGGIAGMAAGPLGSAVGAGAGRSVQNAIQAGMGGRDISPTQAVGEPLVEGVLQFTGEKVIAPVAQAGIATVGKAVSPLLAGLSGTGMDLIERIFKRPFQTMASRVEGSAELAVGEARDAMAGVIGEAGKKYDSIISALRQSPKYAGEWRFPLKDAIGDTISEVRKDFGFGMTERFGAEEVQAESFRKLVRRTIELESATIDELYFFQKDLNQMYKNNIGKPLGVAIGKIRDTLRDSMGKAVEPIGEANAIYRHLKPIEDFAKKSMNTDNLANLIRGVNRDPKLLKSGKFKALIKAYPEVGKAFDAVLDSLAGEAVAPALNPLPRTGFTGALLGAGANETSPLMMGLAPFISPRFTGRAVAEAGKLSGMMENRAIGRAGGQAAGAAGNELQEAFRKFMENRNKK